MKKAVVTGGAGFIGSHVVDRLAAFGVEVVVVDDFSSGRRDNLTAHGEKVRIVQGDVRDYETLWRACEGADTVFHLAARCVRRSLVDPGGSHEVNATGTLNALRAAKERGVGRFVYCSSSEVYGDAGGETPSAEDAPKRPSTIYGAAKLCGEQYTRVFHRTHGLASVVVRPFNAYGPRSHVSGAEGEVIPRFAVLLKAGLPVVVFGDGRQSRDFTYVEDTASGIVDAAACDALVGESVNLASGTAITVAELATAVGRACGVEAKVRHVGARPGDLARLQGDNAKARRLLRTWAPVPLAAGLARYVAWLDSRGLDFARLAAGLSDQNWIEAAEPDAELFLAARRRVAGRRS